MKSLKINEIFYSLQGEGLDTGKPTIFIRLTGCPLRCSYCDTEYAFTEGEKMLFSEILESIKNFNCKNILVTGGEPLAQQHTKDFLKFLCDQGFIVSLETSNAISIKDIDNRVVTILDIKTPDSNESSKNLTENYTYLKKSDQIKFVIDSENDYEWSKNYIYKFDLNKICDVIMSPSYKKMDIKILAEKILLDSLPARLQIQVHKYIWGNERGK